MTVIINGTDGINVASTTGVINLLGSTSGAVTIAAPAVAGTNTLTLPAATGTVSITGPTFSAYQSSTQNLSSATNTLINLQTESWDTGSFFNNTGSTVGGVPAYAFLPTVAGYYQVNGGIRAGASTTEIIAFIFKNGSNVAYGSNITANGLQSTVSTIVFLNGTTDYIQLYGFVGSGQILNASESTVYFNSCYLRGA
jgi:hypothetical protein